MFSYQCSQLSTSESISNVFEQAIAIQRKIDRNKFVSVVVLDEVGLAEDSPGLPLKVLHPWLEDGTEGSNYSVDVSLHGIGGKMKLQCHVVVFHQVVKIMYSTAHE